MSRIITLETTGSTNTYLKNLIAQSPAPLPDITIVSARTQTAGRGQRGNSWESEPGKNLTLSALLYPAMLDVSAQFAVSEAVAVAVADTLQQYLPANKVQVKWPNDIYVDNRKICGILIENSLSGRCIERSIAGIGINANQTIFRSDAPNPVSLAQLTGTQFSLDSILSSLIAALERFHSLLLSRDPGLHSRYMSLLWRGSGFHPYLDPATARRFSARIISVEPSGHIILEDTNGSRLSFAFKEVVAIL
ncbi:MAG: biotin--[acetyl-CoA-carboxylase] ligase [Muribaculaceae bacterium]|nr:biotin--[acetyl-CoA-carboxylase] ligase [Muribaculaceae bacterium]